MMKMIWSILLLLFSIKQSVFAFTPSFHKTTTKNVESRNNNIIGISSSLKSLSSSNEQNVVEQEEKEKIKKMILTYSPWSLEHLKAVELPDNYGVFSSSSNILTWNNDKKAALAVALGSGAVGAIVVNIVAKQILGITNDDILSTLFLLSSAVSSAVGWNIMGGPQLSRQEYQPLNGGYDGKLIADRPERLKTTIQQLLKQQQEETTTTFIQQDSRNLTRTQDELIKWISYVHDANYIEKVKTKSLETDRPIRFNPRFVRTMICNSTYMAALASVDGWLNSVNAALEGDNNNDNLLQFALTRPPSHHACRTKPMGGCFFNSVGIAAIYALDCMIRRQRNREEEEENDFSKSIPIKGRVLILDLDAHHGNGIAQAIQAYSQIKYVSIHENVKTNAIVGGSNGDAENPRTPSTDDVGPLGNIRNINLPSGSNINDYQTVLEETVWPFFENKQSQDDDPVILLVALGLDAMEADWSSNLQLQPNDYYTLGRMIRQKYGNNVAVGLEGGYAWQNQELAEGISAFVRAWNE